MALDIVSRSTSGPRKCGSKKDVHFDNHVSVPMGLSTRVEEDVARLLDDVSAEGGRFKVHSGGTSSQVLHEPRVDDLPGRAFLLDVPTVDSLGVFDDFESAGLIRVSRVQSADLEYSHEVDAVSNLPIDLLNQWLVSRYGVSVNFGVTTGLTSSIGGNLMTGAKGDPRFGIPALAAKMIRPGQGSKWIQNADAFRAGQGASGVLSRLLLPASEQLVDYEYYVLDMAGDDFESVYVDGWGSVLEVMYPFFLGRVDEVHAACAEIISTQGLDTIERIENLHGVNTPAGLGTATANARRFRKEFMDSRETYGGIFVVAVEKRRGLANLMEIDHGFVSALDELVENGIVRQWHPIDPAYGADQRAIVDNVWQLRHDVPYMGRQSAVSSSMDMDIVIRCREGVSGSDVKRAHRASMRPYVVLRNKLVPNGIFDMINGHEASLRSSDLFVPGLPRPYIGGRNMHVRWIDLEGRREMKPFIDSSIAEARTEVTDLDGLVFGEASLESQIWGEKWYPGKMDSVGRSWFVHFSEKYPDAARAMAQDALTASSSSNYRIVHSALGRAMHGFMSRDGAAAAR